MSHGLIFILEGQAIRYTGPQPGRFTLLVMGVPHNTDKTLRLIKDQARYFKQLKRSA